MTSREARTQVAFRAPGPKLRHTGAVSKRVAIAFSDRPDAEMAAGLASSEAAAAIGRDKVASVLLVAAGAHTVDAAALLKGAQRCLPNATIAVVGGPTLLLAGGERASGVAAMCFRASIAATVATPTDEDLSPLGADLHAKRARPLFLFGQRTLLPSVLDGFCRSAATHNIAGGGVDPSAELGLARRGEPPRTGTALAIRIDGGLRMLCDYTSAVQTISRQHRVDEVAAGFVASIDGRAPLERLGRAVRDRHDRPLVLVAIQRGDGPPVIRGIGGIDPHRGALHVGDDVRVGDLFSFCVPRPDQAREDLSASLRRLLGETNGGAPVCCFYFDSVGRGANIFGEPNVDIRILRKGLDDVPFLGLRVSSQILGSYESAQLAGHCGALALLYVPS